MWRWSAILAVLCALVGAGDAQAATLPVGHAKGVSVRVSRHAVEFRFTKAIDLTVAAILRPKRQVELSCTTLGPLAIDGGRTSSRITQRVKVPAHRTPLRLPTGTRQHPSFCTLRLVSTHLDIVDIPVTEDGAAYIDERHTLYGLRNAAFTASSDAQDAHSAMFETADQYISKYAQDGDMVALATPDATPPAGTLGIFSDGAHHFAAVALSTLGRRMFYDINGDVLTTNGTPYLTDPDGA
jgi:hypothetical protein